MRGDFFKGVIQQPVTVAGREGKLPAFYQDTSTMLAVFSASTSKVDALLPHRDLHAVELRPGRALVAIAGLDHRRSDLGSYGEMMIGPLCTFGRRSVPLFDMVAQVLRRSVSVYVRHLPATTELAYVAGVEIYGFPKFIAEIAFTGEDRKLRCRLSERGAHIVTLTANELGIYRPRRLHGSFYSLRSGEPLCADTELNSLEFAQTLRRHAAALELGTEHPIAKELASLDLDPRPVLYQHSRAGEAILYAPHPAAAAHRRVA